MTVPIQDKWRGVQEGAKLPMDVAQVTVKLKLAMCEAHIAVNEAQLAVEAAQVGVEVTQKRAKLLMVVAQATVKLALIVVVEVQVATEVAPLTMDVARVA